MAETSGGFIGRWAQRKNDVRQGKPVAEPAVPEQPVPAAPRPLAGPPTVPVAASGVAVNAQAGDTATEGEDKKSLPALSLEDVKMLTKESDFSPFMASNVGPEIRNAAMKKLFEDPHFNIMDGLDIYIDDYSISEPIPESMLRQMVSAKFLNLFEEEEEDDEDAKAQQKSALLPVEGTQPLVPVQAAATISDSTQSELPVSNEPTSQAEVTAPSAASQENHAHSHLRLQPNHAASSPETGRSTE